MVHAAELSRMFWDEWKLCCLKALKEAGLMVRGRLLVSSYLTETHIEGDRKVDACLKNHLERSELTFTAVSGVTWASYAPLACM